MTPSDREQVIKLLPEGLFSSSPTSIEGLTGLKATIDSAAARATRGKDPVEDGEEDLSSLQPEKMSTSEGFIEEHELTEPAASEEEGRSEAPLRGHNEGI